MAINTKTCGSCAIQRHNHGTCPYFQQPMNSNDPACAKYCDEVVTCDLCKGITTPAASYLDLTDPSNPHRVCSNCKQHYGHCPVCIHSVNCLFETDPSPLPKIVQREIRQGNMISVTQVMNPERIRQTCEKDCSCFDRENGCLRQNNTCANYKMIYDA